MMVTLERIHATHITRRSKDFRKMFGCQSGEGHPKIVTLSKARWYHERKGLNECFTQKKTKKTKTQPTDRWTLCTSPLVPKLDTLRQLTPHVHGVVIIWDRWICVFFSKPRCSIVLLSLKIPRRPNVLHTRVCVVVSCQLVWDWVSL